MRFVLISYSLFKEVFTKTEVKNDLVSGQLKAKKPKNELSNITEKIESKMVKTRNQLRNGKKILFFLIT